MQALPSGQIVYRWITCLTVLTVIVITPVQGEDFPGRLLWGDTHVHSNLSNDAYLLGNRSADPDTAYRFAKGEPVIHPYHRAKVKIQTPLDFLAVTDHAEFLGQLYSILWLEDARLVNTRFGKRMLKVKQDGDELGAGLIYMMALALDKMPPEQRPDFSLPGIVKMLYNRFFAGDETWDNPDMPMLDFGLGNMWFAARNFEAVKDIHIDEVFRSNWERLLDTADRHNAPGQFTALIGWEYSPQPGGKNLHRVILTPVAGSAAKQIFPYSANDSENPEDLWLWLAKTRERTGIDFVAIPHNSNLSKGSMFSRTTTSGDFLDTGYARLRSDWETVVEVTQTKGTSETHPLLSPGDEFAGFEIYKKGLPGTSPPTFTEADYVRSALKTGLELDRQLGVNPYRLGMIGSTDSHTGLASAEEDNFMGKFAQDSLPENKDEGFYGYPGWLYSASGLAAIWARDNTREEIFAAFKRREVYASTGPRIRVRFFAGYDFSGEDLNRRNLAAAGYGKGVPMGGSLTATDRAPGFLIHAVKDPDGANLDRVQVVKSWLDADGKALEKVFNAVWSDGRIPDPDGNLPPVGDRVDRRSAGYANDIGAVELATVWTDPEFDPDNPALYYLRVLQIPTPRNSLYDSVGLQIEPPEGYPEVIRERAFTSPIWYSP